MRLDNHLVVVGLVNFNYFVHNMRQLHPRSVHLHTQLLTEINLDIGHLEGDGFGPTRVLRLSRIVRYADGKCVILAIRRELILASALKAKKFAIERLVMRIAEHRAHAGTLDALRTTLVVHLNEILVRSTLYLWTLGLGAANFAGTALA